LIAVEGGRSLVRGAALSLDLADERAAMLVDAAQSFCAERFAKVAQESIQVHGGLGVTWEHPAHLYLKRARGSQSLFGTPSAARARLQPGLGLRSVARG